jgi:hypothetical protein
MIRYLMSVSRQVNRARTAVLGFTICVLLVVTAANAQPAERFVPLFTNFTYWDHHWLQWLPTHPRFEAIEAAVAEVGDKRLIRVWLTERAPPKRQFYYFNDFDAATAQGADSFYRLVRFDYVAEEGKPANLGLTLDDDEGHPIAWTMHFNDTDRLTNAYSGLKPSGGHGEAGRFLVFWTGANTVTQHSETKIGDETFGIAPADLAARRHHYGAAYSRGAWNGALPYARAPIAADYRTSPFGFAGAARLEIIQTTDGVSGLRHWFGMHDMSVAIDPPLPVKPNAGYRGRYAIAFDNGSMPAMHGQIAADGDAYIWRPDEPKWAMRNRLRSMVQPTPSGYVLEVSR